VEPNPAAIAWYMEEAQRLLEDQQRRAESLRTRAGQIAGFGAAVFALIGGNAATILGAAEGFGRVATGAMLFAAAICLAASVAVAIWGVTRPQLFGSLAADEIKVYTSGHFLAEPDLWRVHVRALRAMETSIRRAQENDDAVSAAITISLYGFLTGLGFSLVLLGTLILELI
jgi:hypothetical protein